MVYVYILEGKLGYEAREKDKPEDYKYDLEIARRLGERLVCVFDVPQSVAIDVFSLANGFANAHNSGRRPSLKDLELRVYQLMPHKN